MTVNQRASRVGLSLLCIALTEHCGCDSWRQCVDAKRIAALNMLQCTRVLSLCSFCLATAHMEYVRGRNAAQECHKNQVKGGNTDIKP